jgi:hypothetical protein
MPYMDLPEQTVDATNYIVTGTRTVRGGPIAVPSYNNRAYKTPYQMEYLGMLVQFATIGALTVKDAAGNAVTINPNTLVVKPCTDGARPMGWVFTGTLKYAGITPLSGGTNVYLPLTADLDSDTDPEYATYYNKWTTVTVAALQDQDIVGMPVAATAVIEVGDEIACGDNYGNVCKAQSTDIVIGHAEEKANNSAGAAAAVNCKVRVCHPYASA